MSDPHWSEIMLPRERIEQLECVNSELRQKLQQAQEQSEAFQKRMRELLTVCQAVQWDLLLRAEPDFDGSGVQVVNLSAGFWDELNRVTGKYDDTAAKSFDALILRKQADAIDAVKDRCDEEGSVVSGGDFLEEAQRLRQQADELERVFPECPYALK